MVRAFLMVLLVCISAGQPARADVPEDIVQWIYTSLLHAAPSPEKGLTYLTSPAQREQFFSERMVAFLAANDSYGDDLAAACIDFALDIPGQDFAANEIVRTLKTEASGDGTRQTVVASFTNFQVPAKITYEFIVENGFWRIDDIIGPGWQVSQIPCSAKQAAAPVQPENPGNAYCYQTAGDTLRLEVAGNGQATFALESYQANGHSCTASGPAKPVPGGWVYEAELSGGPCRIEILVTPEQGMRLTDAEWACKRSLCGARAAIDGLTFALENQVHCSMLSRN